MSALAVYISSTCPEKCLGVIVHTVMDLGVLQVENSSAAKLGARKWSERSRLVYFS